MKLNRHGKLCLERFLYALSAMDLRTSQLDYLFEKGLVDYAAGYLDWKDREHIAGHCLTDVGIETAKHYFPKYKKW